ncbi:MAG: hypothetical protein R6U64_00640 [Bacteroidales bacterium]
MMRHFFVCLIMMTLMMGFSMNASAQRGFEDFSREEGLHIQYRWQRASFFDKNSDAVLVMRVTNLTEKPLQVTFAIGFYENQMILFQNRDNQICLKPGQSLRGAPAGLRFGADGITLDQARGEDFTFDIFDLKVKEVESCK